jgi:hypothetical protein
MFDDEIDCEPTDDEVSEFCRQLRARAVELRQTTYAAMMNRRTPAQRQAVYDRCTRAMRRSMLIRRRHALIRAVH